MKKILVTGAGGFIGSHLVEKLTEEGYEVKAFVRYNSKNNWGWLEYSPVKNDIEVITGDIRDYDSVSKAAEDCQAIFHLAALIGIPYSYVSPLAYIKTNIEGTYNILQTAKERNLENIIITSTSETYGTAQRVPIDEDHPLVGQSPYSASKISSDQIALSYHKSFGLPVKIVRPFNTYGPRQSARAVIPTIIAQLLNGKTELQLGNTSPTRDLTFVKDTVNGFLKIFKCEDLIGNVINIGMNEEITIKKLAKTIAELLNVKISVQEDKQRVRPENSEVERLRCDNTKVMKYTGWKPEYDLKNGLIETINWIKINLTMYKHHIYNV
ncbi:MAG: SDR family NAD(P)-dependent oxidoreductase [bacterium]|nr:SDR family NAD(P)-dependent oxidoreductase [bacterium]